MSSKDVQGMDILWRHPQRMSSKGCPLKDVPVMDILKGCPLKDVPGMDILWRYPQRMSQVWISSGDILKGCPQGMDIL